MKSFFPTFDFFFFSFFHIYLQNSSVEGVFAPQRSTHPFRIIESDAISIHSMTSLGRVGRILADSMSVNLESSDTSKISNRGKSISIYFINPSSYYIHIFMKIPSNRQRKCKCVNYRLESIKYCWNQ